MIQASYIYHYNDPNSNLIYEVTYYTDTSVISTATKYTFAGQLNFNVSSLKDSLLFSIQNEKNGEYSLAFTSEPSGRNNSDSENEGYKQISSFFKKSNLFLIENVKIFFYCYVEDLVTLFVLERNKKVIKFNIITNNTHVNYRYILNITKFIFTIIYHNGFHPHIANGLDHFSDIETLYILNGIDVNIYTHSKYNRLDNITVSNTKLNPYIFCHNLNKNIATMGINISVNCISNQYGYVFNGKKIMSEIVYNFMTPSSSYDRRIVHDTIYSVNKSYIVNLITRWDRFIVKSYQQLNDNYKLSSLFMKYTDKRIHMLNISGLITNESKYKLKFNNNDRLVQMFTVEKVEGKSSFMGFHLDNRYTKPSLYNINSNIYSSLRGSLDIVILKRLKLFIVNFDVIPGHSSTSIVQCCHDNKEFTLNFYDPSGYIDNTSFHKVLPVIEFISIYIKAVYRYNVKLESCTLSRGIQYYLRTIDRGYYKFYNFLWLYTNIDLFNHSSSTPIYDARTYIEYFFINNYDKNELYNTVVNFSAEIMNTVDYEIKRHLNMIETELKKSSNIYISSSYPDEIELHLYDKNTLSDIANSGSNIYTSELDIQDILSKLKRLSNIQFITKVKYPSSSNNYSSLLGFKFKGNIIGPYSTLVLRNVKGRNIILMGEQHTAYRQERRFFINNEEYLTPLSILAKIINQAQYKDECIDIYLESNINIDRYHNVKPTKTSSLLHDDSHTNTNYLRELIQHRVYIKGLDNVRLHDFEARSIYSEDNKIRYVNPFNDIFLNHERSIFKTPGSTDEPIFKKYLFTDPEMSFEYLKQNHLDWLGSEDEDPGIWFFQYLRPELENSKLAHAIEKEKRYLTDIFTLAPITNIENIRHWFDYFIGVHSDYDAIINSILKQLNRVENIIWGENKLGWANDIDLGTSTPRDTSLKIITKVIFDKFRKKLYVKYKKLTIKQQSDLKKAYTNYVWKEFLDSNETKDALSEQLYVLSIFYVHMYTDVYMFLRIFTDWSTSDITKTGRGPCKGTKYQQKNIIVYGGANHTNILEYLISIVFGVSPIHKFEDNIYWRSRIPEETILI